MCRLAVPTRALNYLRAPPSPSLLSILIVRGPRLARSLSSAPSPTLHPVRAELLMPLLPYQKEFLAWAVDQVPRGPAAVLCWYCYGTALVLPWNCFGGRCPAALAYACPDHVPV